MTAGPLDPFGSGGLSLSDLLRLSPTPFYVYSGPVIRGQYARLAQALPGFEVFFSLKANPNPAVCRLLKSLGARAETSSIGELRSALKTGFRPRNVIFLGPGKTEREIRAALDARVHALVAESAIELQQIDELAARRKENPGVLLRVNTLEQMTGAGEVMGGGPSKFGFDEESIVSEVRRLDVRHVRLLGFQDYPASQVLDAGVISGHFDYLLRLAPRLAREIGFPLRCIDFGGGFGVPYEPGQRKLDLARLSRRVRQLMRRNAAQLVDCRLIVESGRFLTAESGVFVTRVIRVKESRGKRFVITDGGMNHFSRPAFMGVAHRVKLLNRPARGSLRACDVCGPLCTPIDLLATDCRLPDVRPGDYLGILDAGAYGYSMSLQRFLSFGTPGEILVDRGRPVFVRRRTI